VGSCEIARRYSEYQDEAQYLSVLRRGALAPFSDIPLAYLLPFPYETLIHKHF